MSARRRESTPGVRTSQGDSGWRHQALYEYRASQFDLAEAPAAPAVEAHGFAKGAAPSAPDLGSFREERRSPSEARRGKRHKDIVEHKCTDVCCLLFFVMFNAVLVGVARHSLIHGDMKRLSSGFDFMGRMCDVQRADPGAALAKVQNINGDYVYWCSTKNPSDKVEVQWNKPICVDHCPTTEEETVFCPEGTPETVMSESSTFSGNVILEQKTSQRFTSWSTVPTRRISQFCFPTDFGPTALMNLQDRSNGSWADVLLQGVDAVWQFQDSPRLMLVLLLVSFMAGLIWIITVHFSALILAHVTFLIVALATLMAGLAIVLSPHADELASSGFGASLSGSLSAASHSGIFSLVATWARRFGALASMFGIPYANVLVGLLVVGAGVGLLLWYCYARRSIDLAAVSMREGCKILMRNPSLIIVLPVAELLCMGLVVLAGAAGFAVLLSTMEVHAKSVQVLGETLSGFHRSFAWETNVVLCAVLWALATLWFLELVAAMRSYVISYTAANHYFGKGTGTIGSWIPIVKAAKVGLWYHFGSLVFGSFCLAILRALQLLLSALYCFLPEKKEKSSRLLKWTIGSLDLLVTFVRDVLQRVSDHTYTHILLTSDSFCTAAQSAADIMLRHASLIWFQTVVLRPMMLLGTTILSMGLGIAIWLALINMPPALGQLFPPLAALFAEAQAVNPGVVGMAGGIMSLAVVRTFSGIVNLTADAVLYCFLWDKEDGVVDAKNVPKCFKDYCQ